MIFTQLAALSRFLIPLCCSRFLEESNVVHLLWEAWEVLHSFHVAAAHVLLLLDARVELKVFIGNHGYLYLFRVE